MLSVANRVPAVLLLLVVGMVLLLVVMFAVLMIGGGPYFKGAHVASMLRGPSRTGLAQLCSMIGVARTG